MDNININELIADVCHLHNTPTNAVTKQHRSSLAQKIKQYTTDANDLVRLRIAVSSAEAENVQDLAYDLDRAASGAKEIMDEIYALTKLFLQADIEKLLMEDSKLTSTDNQLYQDLAFARKIEYRLLQLTEEEYVRESIILPAEVETFMAGLTSSSRLATSLDMIEKVCNAYQSSDPDEAGIPLFFGCGNLQGMLEFLLNLLGMPTDNISDEQKDDDDTLTNEGIYDQLIESLVPLFESSIVGNQFVGLAGKEQDFRLVLTQYEEYFCNQILGYTTEKSGKKIVYIGLKELVLADQIRASITADNVMDARIKTILDCCNQCLQLEQDFKGSPAFSKTREAFLTATKMITENLNGQMLIIFLENVSSPFNPEHN